MSNFPLDYDNDTTLPVINDNILSIGGDAINALRDAVFSIEQNLGLQAAGNTSSVSERLNVAFNPDGTLKPSTITSLGLVVLPITDNQISSTAQITESKLKLDHRTQDLFNYIRDLAGNLNTSFGWISTTGIKLQPHISGALYRHTLNHIDIEVNKFLQNKFRELRNNDDAYELIDDINDELLTHQWADGSAFTALNSVVTFNGSVYPSTYAHTSSGVFLNTSRFSTIPKTAQDLQQFAEYIDSASIFLYGTRIQNLYSNGISKVSRASNLNSDGYGAPVVPPTPAITYLLNTGVGSSPVDDINNGDDLIELKPSNQDINSNLFDAKFALVSVGDKIKVNYGGVETEFFIKEKKYIQNSGSKKYIVRIAGKNLMYSANASVRIDKPLFNNNKFGVLAMAAANNNFATTPSLIIGSSRGAQVLGLGFNANKFDNTHYLLYLALYPNGNPNDGYTILPPIDVTGNRGLTPGRYTLESIVESTNNAFRQSGYNYRFIAFSYQGEFGIMLADSYNNAGFSVLNAVVTSEGVYDPLATAINFQNNVVGVFPALPFLSAPDPLGFGNEGANIASPPFMTVYGSAEASQYPTKLFLPFKRQNYYINGIEREKMTLEAGQALDEYGDGYWVGVIVANNIIPAPAPTGRVSTTYRIYQNLQHSSLKAGKTIVIQSLDQQGVINYGRFIIQSITFGCVDNAFTDISVYDSVHGTGFSPTTTLDINSQVAIYFNSDSVSFNSESATDVNSIAPFKRYFEVYIDQESRTFTHERGRFNASSESILVNGTVPLHTFSGLNKLDIVKISPKLRGYQVGAVNKVSLHILNYDDITGFFDGYLCSYNNSLFTNKGPIIQGKKGVVTRFYDETNIDYIDIIFNVNTIISNFISTPTSHKVLDIQLFPTLSLNEEIMLIGACQLDDVNYTVSRISDERQFGNVSEKELSSSALNFISFPEKMLHGNGVIRGFDLSDRGFNESLELIPNPEQSQIFLNGGLALVNGKFIQSNNATIIIPLLKELYGVLYDINWILCVNDKGEYISLPLLDFDSALGTPNNPNRILKAFNLINGSSYYLTGTVFSDLVNNRKDLVPLYIVASRTIAGVGDTPASITLSITDARKYVNDIDTNLPLRLTSAMSQGNFKSPVSLFNWIKYNNVFNSTAYVKGADSSSGVINTDIILDFQSTAIIDGENDALLTMNGSVIFGSNLIIKNLDIIFNNNIFVRNGASNIKFENCNITIQTPTSAPVDNVIFDFIDSDNIVIQDCNIYVQYNSLYSAENNTRGAVFRLTNTTDFKFTNTNLSGVGGDNIFAIQAGEITPGNIFNLINSHNAIIEDSNISGNFNKFIDINASSGLRLTNLNITSIYNPNTGVLPDSYDNVDYNPNNLVNSGQGWIYANINTILENIQIEYITFNYKPISVSGAADRYSIINFELTSNKSVLSNVSIKHCKFNNMLAGTLYDDIRPAIAIINTAEAGNALNQQPIITGVQICHNICNKNQSIIVTSVTDINGRMVYPGLVSMNCNIDDNVCGTIGYWVSSGTKTIGLTPNVNELPDRMSGFNIKNNICHYISNLDSTGLYFTVSKVISGETVNMCDYPSGNIVITKNKINWIHTGVSFEESSSLQITDNILNAYNESYMNQFNDNILSTPNRGHGYAILVTSNKRVTLNAHNLALGEGEGNDSTCFICGNTVSAGYWLQITLTKSIFKYSAGYIYCQSSSFIKNNILKGIEDTSINGVPTAAIAISGINNIISHNKIYRSNNSISAYVQFLNSDIPEWNGAGSSGIIVDNYFDSPFINSSSLNEDVINILPNAINNWIFERNKNQTGYAIVSPTNQFTFTQAQGWGPSPVNTSLYVKSLNDITNDTNHLTGLPWGAARSKTCLIRDSFSPAANRFWFGQEDLEKYLPNNVRLISISAGLRSFHSRVTYSEDPDVTTPISSNFWLNLSSTNPAVNYINTNNYATNSDSVKDSSILELNAPVMTKVTGGQINSTSGHVPFSINLENYNGSNISSTYVTGRGKGITISWAWVWRREDFISLRIIISALKVKYRW
jgi:hypothetical protein